MRDLGNERRAVVQRLHQLNIEPVNAENLPPTGSSSWSQIEQEIKTCQIFILISGRTYGWVPSAGPGGGEERSITHMEALKARTHGLIILPFFMELEAGEKASDDTKARDAFREEIASWEHGYFRQTFKWADELADLVGQSVSAVLAQAFEREFQVKTARASISRAEVAALTPTNLHESVARGSWVSPSAVLMAGAGLSLSAGYPTAAVLVDQLLKTLGVGAPGSEILSRHSFADIAELYERQYSRDALLKCVTDSLLNQDAFGPTRAHIAAVRVFKTIVTSNFDLLFESACSALRRPYRVITPSDEIVHGAADETTLIFKIDGSIDTPGSLVLTKNDAEAAARKDGFWEDIKARVRGNPLIVCGHSLRDAPSKRIPEAQIHSAGAYVTPFLSDADSIILQKFRLAGIQADADSFMIAYEQAIANRAQ